MPSWGHGGVFSLEIVDERLGSKTFRASGPDAESIFKDEAGGHRFQRIPPTEKRGRVQTSTITVAVLTEIPEAQLRIDHKDLEITATRGTGPGGQARNTTDSCIQITHKPTRLQVRCDTERSQHQNRATAMSMLRAKLWERMQSEQISAVANARKQMVGSGQRGDKTWTVRTQDGVVTHHRTGKKIRLSDYLKGDYCV